MSTELLTYITPYAAAAVAILLIVIRRMANTPTAGDIGPFPTVYILLFFCTVTAILFHRFGPSPLAAILLTIPTAVTAHSVMTDVEKRERP